MAIGPASLGGEHELTFKDVSRAVENGWKCDPPPNIYIDGELLNPSHPRWSEIVESVKEADENLEPPGSRHLACISVKRDQADERDFEFLLRVLNDRGIQDALVAFSKSLRASKPCDDEIP